MINKRERLWRKVIQCLVFVLICTLFLPCLGMKAQAATTCKTKIAYPASTTAQVNFRKKAGTKYKSYGLLKKDQSLTVLGWCTNQGVKWYKCRTKVNGKNKTGYISSAYVQLKSNPSGYVNSKVSTTLNVRKKAKTSAKVLMKIPKNTKVSVRGVKYANKKYWYKVKVTYKKKTKTGYVDSTYISIGSSNNSTDTTNKNPTNTDTTLKGYVNEKVTSKLNVRNEASCNS